MLHGLSPEVIESMAQVKHKAGASKVGVPPRGLTRATSAKRPPARNPLQTGISAKSGSMLKSV